MIPPRQKIVFFGGMANAMYAMAQALAGGRHQVTYIRDPFDLYPLSQPVWHDCKHVFSQSEFQAMCKWTPEDWSQFEESINWPKPAWFQEPKARAGRRSLLNLLPWRVSGSSLDDQIVALMDENDIVVVCGTSGERLALRTKARFVIWPHGGDARIAAEAKRSPPQSRNALATTLLKAFSEAAALSSHDPTMVGGTFENNLSLLEGRKLNFLPMPYVPIPRPDRAGRVAQRAVILKELGLSMDPTDFLCLVPSRLDLKWKGQDRLLKAVRNVPQMKLLFMGWGADHESSKVSDFPASQVLFPGFMFAKQKLRELMQVADAIADQFTFGTYGAVAIEAMAAGAPLIMWLDADAFVRQGWEVPPIYNSRSLEDISKALARVVACEGDDPDYSRSLSLWYTEHHTVEAFRASIDRILNDVLQKPSSPLRGEAGLASVDSK